MMRITTAARAAPLLLGLLAGCNREPTTPLLETTVAGLFTEGISLEVGEVLTLEAGEAQAVFLQGGENGAEYLYVPFNASETGPAQITLEVQGGNISPPTGPPTPALVPGTGSSLAPESQPDWDFHQRLRERERRELGPLVRSGGQQGWAGAAASGSAAAQALQQGIPANPSVGQTVTINTNSSQACTLPEASEGRVVAVSTRAVVVEDLRNPSGGFTLEEYQSIAATFDTLIYPVDVLNFGDPVFGSFITPQDRIVIFYTRAVNELTPPDANSLVGGFFFGRDLFPQVTTGAFSGCPASNQAPIMYLLAPDPNGEVNNNVRTKERVLRTTLSTVAHEFQHLINQARRFFVFSSGEPFEEVWLNEGLSHIAEEVNFYAASGLSPRSNIGVAELRAVADRRAIDAFNTFQGDNIGRFASYLENPDTASLLGVDNLPTRGASWAFLRYAADQEAGSDAAFFRALVDGGESGVENLAAALQVDPIDLMQTWTVSNYTDDALPDVAFGPLFQQPSWNYRDIYTTILGRYPLRVTSLAGAQRTFTLMGGGSAYVRFAVSAGQRASILTTSGGLVPSDRLRISVVRLR